MTFDALPRLSAALADRYRIERELGQGAMATVYVAEDLKHERQVAIKVLREDLSPRAVLLLSVRLIHIGTYENYPQYR